MSARGAALVMWLLATGCGGEDPLGPDDLARVPAALQVLSGDGQTDTIGALLAVPLTVRLESADAAEPITGVIVNFVVPDPACGRAFAGSALTTSDGRATDRWQLGTKAGPCVMEARAVDPDGTARVLATMSATAQPGAPASYTSGPQGRQGGAWVGDTINLAGVVRVLDRGGNTVTDPSATIQALPSGATSVGGARVTAAREIEGAVDVQFGSASAARARDITVGWYRKLDTNRWGLSFACFGSEGVDSIVGQATVSAVRYQTPPRALSIIAELTIDGTIRKFRGASVESAPWPRTSVIQRAGSVQFSIQTGPDVFDQSFTARSTQPVPTRYESAILCHSRVVGAAFGTPQKRPIVMETVG